MQTEWIWAAKANQAILTKKRSQKVWLKQDLLNRKHVYALLQRSRDIFFSLLAIYRSFSADVVNGSADCAG